MKKVIFYILLLTILRMPTDVYAGEKGDSATEIDFSEWEEAIKESA